MNEQTIVELSGVKKQFKSFTLGPLDFELEQGMIAAIVGPNGSGKSTMFRLMMNLIQHEEGTIRWFGEALPLDDSSVKQHIGYASSGLYDIFGHCSIKQLASLVSYWYLNWDQERFLQLVKRYDVDLNEKYANCSTGTKKKVDFILATAHQPKLLLLDEYSSGVDMMSQRKMKEDLLALMDSGERSILLATHIQEEVEQLSDRVCILQKGQIIKQFDKDEVMQKWARLWISSLPAPLKNHPAIKKVDTNPLQIVTDQLTELTPLLEREGVQVQHVKRLEMNEVIEYYLTLANAKAFSKVR